MRTYDHGLPFHPPCFEIFNWVSRERFGRVDAHGFWCWREVGLEFLIANSLAE